MSLIAESLTDNFATVGDTSPWEFRGQNLVILKIAQYELMGKKFIPFCHK